MSATVPGTRFGPYEAISPAGAGGMGEVWKARDTRVDRIVAIKISQQQFSERFEREARASAALNHPNICSLYDVGPDYLVMEYVDGAPIRPPQNVRKLLDLAVQIADGLAAAHDRGITHRDLKPENILVTNDGRVKILDFGLAKHELSAPAQGSTHMATLTQPGLVMGTIAYMSPEQARGVPADPCSDQFSFGVILYELAAGKRPFQRDSAPQTMAAIIEADPEPLPQTVPAPLRWIVERCLAKDPAARYESTRDLFRDLRSLRDHISEAFTTSGPHAAKAEPAWQNWIWTGVAIAGVLLIGAASYLLGTRRTPAAAAPMTPLTSSGGVVLNPSFSPDGLETVFAWDGPRGGPHNLYVKLIGSNDLLRLTNAQTEDISPAWSPDGRQIAFVRGSGPGKRSVMLVSPLGGSERKLAEITWDEFGAEGHSLIAWTPDGRYLAAANHHRMDLISVETGESQALVKEIPGVFDDADPAFAPDGRRLAFVGRLGPFSGRLFQMELASTSGGPPRAAGPAKVVRTPGVVTFSPLWDGQGRLIFASGAPYGMKLYRATMPEGRITALSSPVVGGAMTLHAATGRLIYTSLLSIQNLYRVALDGPGRISQTAERLTSTSGVDMFPVYSPDGNAVAFASFRFGHFGIWTVQTASPLGAELAEWGEGLTATSDWSPDGKSILLFGTGPQGLYQIYRVAVDTRKVTRLIEDASHEIYPTYSRDGKSIYFSSSKGGSLQLYKMPAAGGPATLVAPRGVIEARESADGRWLYFAGYMPGGLARMPLAGGEITPLIERLSAAGYVLAGAGVYYWAGTPAAPELHYMDLDSRRDQLVLKPSRPAVPQISVSPDGRWLCFPLVERNSQELMMETGF